MKLKAVFLDQDGALIPGIHENDKTAALNEPLVEGLQLLQNYGYLLVLVSNKAGSQSGNSSEDTISKVKDSLSTECSKLGIYLDGFYTNPEYSQSAQPEMAHPGMLHKAAGDMDIDLSASWMVGDVINDMAAGEKAGCKTILIDDGEESGWSSASGEVPKFHARDLAEAARHILKS